jgi:hypothetical protein
MPQTKRRPFQLRCGKPLVSNEPSRVVTVEGVGIFAK